MAELQEEFYQYLLCIRACRVHQGDERDAVCMGRGVAEKRRRDDVISQAVDV